MKEPSDDLVRRTATADIPAVMRIFTAAIARMRKGGNHAQWGNGYPSEQVVKADIDHGNSYVIEHAGEIAGVFTFIVGDDPTYGVIDGSWPDDAPYGTIHRIAAADGMHGIADTALHHCLRRGVNIRIDTHELNAPMLSWIRSRGFAYCGIIHLVDGSPRLAFQLSAGALAASQSLR